MDEILWYLRRVPAGPVVGFFAIALAWFLSGSPSAAGFVPEVERLSVQQAQADLAKDSFTARIVVRPGGGRAGTVTRQEPRAGAAYARNRPVTIEVTKGVRQVRLPVVKGKRVDDVRSALQKAGLIPGVVTYRRDATVAPDRVITTSPGPGTAVDIGATIEIIASTP